MNCPVCNRILATNLSICPSCGTMMNDSVREVMETKAAPTTDNLEKKGVSYFQSGFKIQQSLNKWKAK